MTTLAKTSRIIVLLVVGLWAFTYYQLGIIGIVLLAHIWGLSAILTLVMALVLREDDGKES